MLEDKNLYMNPKALHKKVSDLSKVNMHQIYNIQYYEPIDVTNKIVTVLPKLIYDKYISILGEVNALLGNVANRNANRLKDRQSNALANCVTPRKFMHCDDRLNQLTCRPKSSTSNLEMSTINAEVSNRILRLSANECKLEKGIKDHSGYH